MGNKNRVISFISSLSTSGKDTCATPVLASSAHNKTEAQNRFSPACETLPDLSTHKNQLSYQYPQHERTESNSKLISKHNVYQQAVINAEQNTPPELQPIFAFLHSHTNKIYQEGYFLKLDDQNTQGKPNTDRVWTECYAQLVGTILSLWDAAELDLAGQGGEVLPRFINLSDASIKMIESLPTRSDTDAPLQNVLSISTAGKNRYLLHFNSHHSLIQWTAGIRLAMYEHATLQEAYTGALIAGKGKLLNNINSIMDRSRSPTADWVRVRFGAGTPWRRCWCVISPADEKELIKWQKQWKKSPYDRSRPPALKGVVKFYHGKKTKKVQPIATISDAFSAFAVYPQSKPLIDASTLVKVEGSIIIHSNPPSTTEGFVFVMPEVHPAVTGFEILLRWLLPVYDTFGLYGRPGRLVAAAEDIRSLMFAMPTQQRHGYLETIDVISLILEDGSSTWKESQWRKRMKDLTSKRMMAIETDSKTEMMLGSRMDGRSSIGPAHFRGVKFKTDGDDTSVKSSPSTALASNSGTNETFGGYRARTDSAPPMTSVRAQIEASNNHNRSISEAHLLDRFQAQAPPSSREGVGMNRIIESSSGVRQKNEFEETRERSSSEDEPLTDASPVCDLQELRLNTSPGPVATPPAFVHGPGSLPLSKPYQSSELRQANNRISCNTLNQMSGVDDVIETACERNIDTSKEKSPISTAHTETEKAPGINKSRERTQTDEEFRQKSQTNKILHGNYLSVRIVNDEGEIPLTQPRFSDLKSYPTNDSSNQIPLSTKEPLLTPSKQTLKIYERPESDQSTDSNNISVSPALEQQQKKHTNSFQDVPRVFNLEDPKLDKVGSDSVSPRGYFINEDIFDKISYEQSKISIEALKSGSNSNSSYQVRSKKSVEVSRDLDKPRAGVMRTVGDITLESLNGRSDLMALDIDFGPTINYATSKNTGFLKGLGRLNNPNELALNQESSTRGSNVRGRSKSSNLEIEVRNDFVKESRTLAWNPTFASSANLAAHQKGITPEDFVTQRANKASMYTHQRLPSADALRTVAASSSLSGTRLSEKSNPVNHSRSYSSDLSALISHSRNCSGELLQRPNSRAAARTLGPHTHFRNHSTDHLSRMNYSPVSSIGSPQFPSSPSTSNNAWNFKTNFNHINRDQEHPARITDQTVSRPTKSGKIIYQIGPTSTLEIREKGNHAAKQSLSNRVAEQVIQRHQALSQKYNYQTPIDFRAQIQSPNVIMQSGG
ncbi:putative ph domain protein [Golovinomyces cichoracearum]|uniref:Putative ph domain protein n=1 Tax=Golovinomyces cichoracearum TaxID=62708 RepID=A0A420ITV3_9PEZI|nr:putative ph domain protein [Golovinomyces cichoracearum]